MSATTPEQEREELARKILNEVYLGNHNAFLYGHALDIADFILQREAEIRIDERSRVSYEHESFTKELFKDRVTNIKQWWLETAAKAHGDRIAKLEEERDAHVHHK